MLASYIDVWTILPAVREKIDLYAHFGAISYS